MKYVVLQKCGLDFAILFPETIQHCEAVNLLNVKPVAAGYCKIHEDGSVSTWGRSTSLSLGSRTQLDAEAIRFSLAMPCVNFEQEEGHDLAAKERKEHKERHEFHGLARTEEQRT